MTFRPGQAARRQRARVRALLVVSVASAGALAIPIPPVTAAGPGTITTVAGLPNHGDGGAATSATLAFPRSVAVDASGNVYVADTNHRRVRKVATTGVITTTAGNGQYGSNGDGGPATSAQLAMPSGVAVDPSGNVYIADTLGYRVRKVSPSGTITTFAGTGVAGFSGDGGLATSATFEGVSRVAVDNSGNVYISDSGNHRVRKVSASGVITTVAGTGASGFAGDGGAATSAWLNDPQGLAFDSSGNLYVADNGNGRIRQISTAGVITTVAGWRGCCDVGDGGPATKAFLWSPMDVAVNAAGELFIVDSSVSRVRKVSTNGIISTVAAAPLAHPEGLALDPSGNLYVTDTFNDRVRRIDTSGAITTFAGNGGHAGDGGAATAATLHSPRGVAADSAGNLYIADSANHRLRKVTPTGVISTVAGDGTNAFGGDGGPATSASLAYPSGLAVDKAGNVYIADTMNARVRKVSATGAISTVAGNGAWDFGGDGGPAPLASLNQPTGVAVDSHGNLYIADSANNRIRKVDTAGTITTLAGNGAMGSDGDGSLAVLASLAYPSGVTVDAIGDVFIADTWNGRIRKVNPAGVISTVAGGGGWGYNGDGRQAVNAYLQHPEDVAVDSSGSLFIADTWNSRIRKVNPTGIISTVAGSDYGYAGDGGPATAARLAWPSAVGLDRNGDLFVADTVNDLVRRIEGAGVVLRVPADVGAAGI